MRKWFSLLTILVLMFSVFRTAPVAANAEPEEGLVTVVTKSGAISDSVLDAISLAGGTVESRLDEIGVLSVRTGNTGAFLKAMLGNQEIQAVGPSLTLELDLPAEEPDLSAGTSPADPSDPSLYTWGVDRVTNNGGAWDIHTGTKDVVVGIIDTGIDFYHPDLQANIVPGSKTFVPGTKDAYDQHSHGTHVAGTIAANGGIKGVAPNVGIRAYRVFGATGGAQQIWITQALVAAANDGVDVINMSLGGKRVMGQWYYVDPASGERIRLGNDAADTVAYKRAMEYAIRKGATVVVSAGNDGWDLSNKAAVTDAYNAYLDSQPSLKNYEVQGATFVVPAAFPGVVTVSATGGGFGTPDRLAYYSNYGPGAISVAAPGGDIGPNYPPVLEKDYWKYYTLSTVPTWTQCSLPGRLFGNCLYGFKIGTSMAAPHASGVAALIISEEYARTGSKLSPAQVTTRLQQSAEDIGKVGYDAYYGHGLVNAYRALGGK